MWTDRAECEGARIKEGGEGTLEESGGGGGSRGAKR